MAILAKSRDIVKNLLKLFAIPKQGGGLVNKKQEALLIVFIVLLSAGLRVWGLDYGLPHLYDPDEPVFVEHALQILQTGDWNPHWFGHPGTTTIYMNAILYRIIGGIGTALGRYDNWGQFCYTYHVDPTAFYHY